MQGFFKRPPDRHRLADTFHLCGECRVRLLKFLKSETWDFCHHVIDGWLKTGLRLASDVIGQFPQTIADRQLGCDFGNRETRRFGCESARTADAWVHFDDDHVSVVRVDRKLNVRTTRLDSDFANDGETGVSHSLILFVRQRLSGRYRNGITRVDSHRIKIFDGANDHDIVVKIPHHLHLVFFPSDDGLLEKHFGDG